MKKLKYVILVIILFIVLSVKAEGASLSLDCGSRNEFASDKSISCSVNLIYSDINISSISFNYSTDYAISFENSIGTFSDSQKSVNVTLSSNLEATTEKKTTLGKMIVRKGNVNNSGENNITLTNVRVSTGDTSLSLDDFTKTISYISSADAYIDCTLKSIKVNGNLISNFSPNVYNYTKVNSNNTIAFVTAEKNDSRVNVTGLGNVPIMGNIYSSVNVKVSVSESSGLKCRNGDKTYTLIIYYVSDTNNNVNNNTNTNENTNDVEESKSDDNTLSLIELYNGDEKIDFTYDIKKSSFDIKLNQDIPKITIKATLNDSKAKFVSKYGPRNVNLSYGNNKVLLKVNSESNKTKTYTLNIEREDSRSDDNTLSSLKINDVIVKLSKDNSSYEIELPNKEEKTNIEVEPTNDKAKVTYKDIDLLEGDNDLVITVISENGLKKEYNIKIKRLTLEEEEARKHYLENIIIEGYDFVFRYDIKEYDLTINSNEDSLKISTVPKDDIEVSILGNGRLQNNSKVTINVKDDRGDNTYIINIYKKSDILVYVCYSVFGAGLMLFISSIIYLRRKKK